MREARVSHNTPWTIGVFAHNEERNIVACLASLRDAAQHQPLRIYVLANGCTDGTERAVAEYASSHPEVHLVSIALGDKANAWNQYIHEISAESEVVFFMDGDVEAVPGALAALAAALTDDPGANAVCAVPATGRSRDEMTAHAQRERGILGNLYCLRGTFVDRLRKLKVRMPIGLIGDDSIVGALLAWDLEPSKTWDPKRIAVTLDPKAQFRFVSMSPLRLRDIRKYWRRLIRYSMRGYQNKMVGRVLKEKGVAAMPNRMTELYRDYLDACRLEWRGANTFPDWLALREMRAQLSADSARS